MVVSNFAIFSCTNPFGFEEDLWNFYRDRKLMIRLHILVNMVTNNQKRQESSKSHTIWKSYCTFKYYNFSCTNPFGFEEDLWNFYRNRKLMIRLHIIENMVTNNKNRQESSKSHAIWKSYGSSNFAIFSCTLWLWRGFLKFL